MSNRHIDFEITFYITTSIFMQLESRNDIENTKSAIQLPYPISFRRGRRGHRHHD